MRQTELGTKKVSYIVLGAGDFGGDITVSDTFTMIDTYIEAGGSVIDTARVYGEWLPSGGNVSEQIIGKWLSANPAANIFLSPKGAHHHLDTPTVPRVNPSAIAQDIRESIDTLGRPADLYFLHRDDPQVPVGEIMDALHEQVTSGLTTYIGASNWRPERIAEANSYASRAGKTSFTVSQVLLSYAVANPYDDKTIKPYEPQDSDFYKSQNIAVMGFTSQAQGYFSKILKREEAVTGSTKSRFDREDNRERAKRVKTLADRYNASPEAIVLAYFESFPFAALPIIGCRTLEQLKSSLEAADLELSKEDISFLLA